MAFDLNMDKLTNITSNTLNTGSGITSGVAGQGNEIGSILGSLVQVILIVLLIGLLLGIVFLLFSWIMNLIHGVKGIAR